MLTELRRGTWVDPKAGQVSLRSYAETWLSSRPDLRPSTRAKYRYLLGRHIFPGLGHVNMASIQPTDVRAWWAKLARDKPTTAAGAHRLLATICNTAVSDQLIPRSPCRVKGAGSEKSAERPVAGIPEVTSALQAVPERLRLALMLAAWCQLRRGEILGLQRREVDFTRAQLRVDRAVVVHVDGSRALGPPKTKAGRRTVAVPGNVARLLA
jgi:integrase